VLTTGYCYCLWGYSIYIYIGGFNLEGS